MRRQQYLELAFWAAACLPIPLYLMDPPAVPTGRGFGAGDRSLHAALLVVGQLAAVVGLNTLALSFVLVSRFGPLERAMSGLDKMYRLHRHLGKTAAVLLVVHPLSLSLRFVPARIGHFFSFWAPVHRELAVNLGVVAFWLLAVLIVLTLIRRFPYHWWKPAHRLMAVVLILGAWHALAVNPTPGRSVATAGNPLLRWYLFLAVAGGGLGYLHRWFWVPFVHGRYRYRVQKIDRRPSGIALMHLTPVGERISYEPGQFVFARFNQPGLSREQHPFTICGRAGRSGITLGVKALGDFTWQLYEGLQEGATVQLEGPYGRFTYRAGGPRQIWLAGGIGVTPFICWLHDLREAGSSDRRIDFYYCTHSRDQMIYEKELEQWAEHVPGLTLHVVCTSETGHLTADRIALDLQALPDVFMCGPRGFIADLTAQLKSRGVPTDRIHHEAFEFR